MHKIKKAVGIIFSAMLFLPSLVLAQWDISNVTGFGLPEGGGEGIGYVLTGLLEWALAIFGIIAVFAFIIAGVLYLTSAGETDQIGKAKTAMKWSIVGVIVGLGGVIVIETVQYALSGELAPF